MYSFWERESFFKGIDTLIIGSGIVGLSAAISLKTRFPKQKIVILERGTLPYGASTRNAGFACFGSISELLSDLETQSESEVFALVERRFRGLSRLRERVGDKNMEYEQLGGYEVFAENEKEIYEKCAAKMAYFNQILHSLLKIPNIYENAAPEIANFGFSGVKYLLKNKAEGQIDSGKMMRTLMNLAIEKGIEIFTGFSVKDFFDNGNHCVVVNENGGEIITKKIMLCTNGFTQKLLPQLNVLPARNQVLITKPIANLKVKATFHYNEGFFYFRNVGNRILLGGGRNLDKKGEETDAFGHTQLIQNELKKMLENLILPSEKPEIEMWWSGIMGVGEVKKPIIEFVSPNIMVAVRMGGMGVAIGSLVGEEAANLMEN